MATDNNVTIKKNVYYRDESLSFHLKLDIPFTRVTTIFRQIIIENIGVW